MSKLVKNTVIYALGRILPQAVNFILLPLYLEYLKPVEYGIVESMMVLSAFLAIIFSMATERSLFRIYYDYKSEEDRKKLVGNIAVLIGGSSTILLGLVFLLRIPLSGIYENIAFSPYFIYAIFIAYAMTFSFIPKILFQVQENAKDFLALALLAFFLEVGFILYFVVVAKESAVGMLKGKLIGNFLMLPIYLYIINKNMLLKIDKEFLKNILFFSLPMLPSLLTSWVMNMSNRIFIENYFTLKEVGLFSLAFKISSVATIILGAIFSAYNPMFYRLANDKNQKRAKKRLYELNNLLIIIFVMVSIGIIAFSKEVIELLNAQYRESAAMIPILVFSILITNIGGLFNLMIYQNKRSDIMMWIYITGALFSIGLNYLLVPQYGAYGASWVAVISAIVILVLLFYYAQKNYYIPVKVVFSLLLLGGGVVFTVINESIEVSLFYFMAKVIVILFVVHLLYKKMKKII